MKLEDFVTPEQLSVLHRRTEESEALPCSIYSEPFYQLDGGVQLMARRTKQGVRLLLVEANPPGETSDLRAFGCLMLRLGGP